MIIISFVKFIISSVMTTIISSVMIIISIVMCYTTAQACRLLFSSSQLMPASLSSCTDTKQNNLITRLCFNCYTVHNFCCFLPAWYSQNTCRHDTTGEDSNKSSSLSCCGYDHHFQCYQYLYKQQLHCFSGRIVK